VLKNVTLIKVEHMDEVLKHALVLPDPDTFFKSMRAEGAPSADRRCWLKAGCAASRFGGRSGKTEPCA
jgi:hypothetical protein